MSPKTSVLIAEDEAMLRVLVVEMLQDAGFVVFEAGDGIEAFELLKAHPEIALVISDVKMPRMDGYSLIEASKTLRPDLKVLLMTGYAQNPPPDMIHIRDIQTLRKPFDIERLCDLATQMTS